MAWSNSGWQQDGGGWYKNKAAAGGAYTGPGDIVSGANCWYGLRAYSAATIGANAVRLIRASDSTQQDFITLSDGTLDIASITTFLTATTGKVVTLYDQVGTKHLTQATSTSRPDFAFSVIGSRPAVQFTNASNQTLTGPTFTLAQPMTSSMVANRVNNAGGYFSTGGIFLSANSSTNIIGSAGTNLVGVTTVNAFHATQFIINGVNSQFYIDGTLTPASPATTGTNSIGGQALTLGTDTFNALTGYIAEFGLWPSAFTSGNSGLNSNQHTYWGF